jgi:hypothetical protein
MGEKTMLDKKLTEVQLQRLKMLENRQWMEENFFEIQSKHGGNWIVILDKKIVASGESFEEIKESLKGREMEAVVALVPIGKIPKPV